MLLPNTLADWYCTIFTCNVIMSPPFPDTAVYMYDAPSYLIFEGGGLMEHVQTTWPVFAGDNQEAPAEYRFVYNLLAFKKKFLPFYLLVIFLWFAGAAVMVFFTSMDSFPFVNFLFFIFYLSATVSLFLVFLFYLPRLSITFNQEGMVCTGFLSTQMPARCAWSELAKIGINTLPVFLIRQLVFIHRSGKSWVLLIAMKNVEHFVGVGHSLSIEEALARYTGPALAASEFSDEDKEKVPALRATIDLGKEVGHVAYTAVGITVWLVVVSFLPNRPYLLDNALETPFLYGTGLCAALLAGWHMRHIKQKLIMPIPAILVGVALALLLGALTSFLPAFFGKEERIVFVIDEENDEAQRWQATADATLTFSVYARPDERIYQGLGTEQTMMVYRGPWSLNALHNDEYCALFHELPRHQKKDKDKAAADATTTGIESRGRH
jgi:hypothetical protein